MAQHFKVPGHFHNSMPTNPSICIKTAKWRITNCFSYKSRDMVTRFIRDGYIMKHSLMGTLCTCHVLDIQVHKYAQMSSRDAIWK